jgi:hypothetical protein
MARKRPPIDSIVRDDGDDAVLTVAAKQHCMRSFDPTEGNPMPSWRASSWNSSEGTLDPDAELELRRGPVLVAA